MAQVDEKHIVTKGIGFQNVRLHVGYVERPVERPA